MLALEKWFKSSTVIVFWWPSSIRSSERRGIITITSAVWSTSRLSTRAVYFYASHVTLGRSHQEKVAEKLKRLAFIVGSFHCLSLHAVMQLYISSWPNEAYKFTKLTECIVHIKNCMTRNFLLLNSEKKVFIIKRGVNYQTKTSACNVTSRLDYCNALLGGCSACLIKILQMV